MVVVAAHLAVVVASEEATAHPCAEATAVLLEATHPEVEDTAVATAVAAAVAIILTEQTSARFDDHDTPCFWRRRTCQSETAQTQAK